MAQRTREQTDFVPHLPDLIVSTAACWRAIRDAQTEVDPFGRSYGALGDARASLETLAYVLTGQSGFLALGAPPSPAVRGDAVAFHDDAEPF